MAEPGWSAPKNRSFVFLISHMRSYSSLLGHLLAQTPSIDGYSELHRAYESEHDLARMADDVQDTLDGPLRGDRLFDKLLHRACTVAPEIANRDDVRIILSVRTPAPTLASMVALGSRDESVRWAADPERALLHYCRRLTDIRAMAQAAPSAALLIADGLVTTPRVTLDAIGSFLGLDEAIPEHYSVQPLTGMKKSGDSSPNIRSGTILAPPSELGAKIPQDVVEAGQVAFRELLASKEMRSLVAVVDPAQYVEG